jgi:ABC-type transporter Mla MlaB component
VQKSTALKIDEALTIHQVAKLYQQWQLLRDTKLLNIDASSVKEVDAAGLQLLYFLISGIRANDGSATWDPKPSEYLLNKIEMAGMYKALLLNQGDNHDSGFDSR